MVKLSDESLIFMPITMNVIDAVFKGIDETEVTLKPRCLLPVMSERNFIG